MRKLDKDRPLFSMPSRASGKQTGEILSLANREFGKDITLGKFTKGMQLIINNG